MSRGELDELGEGDYCEAVFGEGRLVKPRATGAEEPPVDGGWWIHEPLRGRWWRAMN